MSEIQHARITFMGLSGRRRGTLVLYSTIPDGIHGWTAASPEVIAVLQNVKVDTIIHVTWKHTTIIKVGVERSIEDRLDRLEKIVLALAESRQPHPQQFEPIFDLFGEDLRMLDELRKDIDHVRK